MDLINLPNSSQIVKEQDLHKPVARGLFTLDGQIDIQANNIIEQIEVLKRQALEIQEKKRISKKIYQSEIKFEPIVFMIVGMLYFIFCIVHFSHLSIFSNPGLLDTRTVNNLD